MVYKRPEGYKVSMWFINDRKANMASMWFINDRKANMALMWFINDWKAEQGFNVVYE